VISRLQKFAVSLLATENSTQEKAEAPKKTIAPRESYNNIRKVVNFGNHSHESHFCFGNTWNPVLKASDDQMLVFEKERFYTLDIDLFSEDDVTPKRYISSNDRVQGRSVAESPGTTC